jgi:peptidyl-prolyl cis-trans isomerase C
MKSVLVAILATSAFSVSAQEDTILIDGVEVDLTVADMQKALLSMDKDARGALLPNPGGIRRLMDTTYLAKVAAQRAINKGMDKSKEIQARFWIHEMNVLALAEMNDVLSKAGMNLDSAAREYYLLHQGEFLAPEMVSASHILVRGKTDEELAAALEKIQHVKKLIDSGELSFEDAARKYSNDGSAGKGGDLGEFARGQMVVPFEQSVFSLEKEGQVSEPVKTRFGYHLIRLDKKISPRSLSFEEVKPKIIAKLEEAKKKQIREDYLVEIRDDPGIKLNDQAIERFVKKPVLE